MSKTVKKAKGHDAFLHFSLTNRNIMVTNFIPKCS